MRIVNGILCVLFVAFVLVQYNDPDWWFWMPVYAVPAAWAGVAFFRPAQLARPVAAAGLGLSLLGALAGTAWLWPTEAGFWQRDVWWQSEAAREGMGMMIVAAGLAVTAIAGFLGRGRDTPAPQGENSRLST